MFKCWDITYDSRELSHAGQTIHANDAKNAAECYAEACWWDAGCDGTERVILVEAEDNERTKWLVSGEAVMVWNATAQ